MTNSSYRAGMRAVAPIAAAALAFGVSFGVLARAAGMGQVAPIVMSATTFAGSAQFAAASILDDGGTVVAAVAAAVLLNARYATISIAVAPSLGGSVWRRFAEAQAVVDESWAVSLRPGGGVDRRVLVGAALLLYPCWIAGTTIGTLGGSFLGDPSRLGLDAAFPALFLALLAPQLRGRRAAVAAALAAGTALALVPVAPAGVSVIAAGAACLVGLVRA